MKLNLSNFARLNARLDEIVKPLSENDHDIPHSSEDLVLRELAIAVLTFPTFGRSLALPKGEVAEPSATLASHVNDGGVGGTSFTISVAKRALLFLLQEHLELIIFSKDTLHVGIGFEQNDPKLSHGHWSLTQEWNGDNQISFVGGN